MTFRNLTNTEMLGITGVLIARDGMRSLFETTPVLLGLLPGVEHVHTQIATLSTSATETEKELATLSAEGTTLDVQHHDRFVRGIHATFAGASELDPAHADDYARLSERVLPQGLATSQQSWLGESGNAARVERDLAEDPSFRDELAGIAVAGGRTMLDAVRDLVRVGKRLGAIETRRAELRARLVSGRSGAANDATSGEDAATEATTAPVSSSAARGEWVTVLNTLCATLRMPKLAVDASVREKILSFVTEAEKRADARNRRAGKAQDATEETPVENAPPAQPEPVKIPA